MLVLKMAAITSLILGISSPVLQYKAQATGSDYVIAIDTSSSMTATDLEPSRLEAAKSVSSTFTSQLSNQTEVGSLGFSGKISDKTQLKDSKQDVKEFISTYDIGSFGGTAIGDAIYTSTNMLMNTDENRTIILITDGVSTTGRSVNESIQYAKQRQVKINAIGIGSLKKDQQRGNSSKIEYPNLNSSRLKQISNATDGAYSTVTSRGELEEALLNMEETTVDTELSDYLIFLALILFLGEWVLGTTRFDVLP
jgi:von Willebrand factor type A domain.